MDQNDFLNVHFHVPVEAMRDAGTVLARHPEIENPVIIITVGDHIGLARLAQGSSGPSAEGYRALVAGPTEGMGYTVGIGRLEDLLAAVSPDCLEGALF